MKWAMAAITVALAMTLASCQRPAAPVISNGQAAVGGADSAKYLDELSSRPTVTEAQAVEGIMLLLGKQQNTTFAEAVKLLVDQKIADPAWGFQADSVKGGLTLTLTGPSRRYCLRELQYRGLMAWGLPYNPVTGMEYVAILARADELRETGKVSAVMVQEGG